MSSFVDLTGLRFGRLVALRPIREAGAKVRWECVCDCGNRTSSMSGNLRTGNALSCGCLRTERAIASTKKHGMKGTPAYRVWRNMLERCNRPSNAHYSSYGGRGISVCQRWHEFAKFFSDMGKPPAGHVIDRIDNDGNYFKENCRWATKIESANNKRNTVMVEFDGERLPVTEVAQRLGIKHKTLKYRLRHWSLQRALTKPVQPWGHVGPEAT